MINKCYAAWARNVDCFGEEIVIQYMFLKGLVIHCYIVQSGS